jgi:DNA-binding IclR family transcriptional regulator
MLDRLVRRGYVRRNSEDRYDLTLKLFELSHHAIPPMQRLVSHAMPVMRQFALRNPSRPSIWWSTIAVPSW